MNADVGKSGRSNDCQPPAEAEEGRKALPPEPSQAAGPCQHLRLQTSGPHNRENTFLLFKPPGSWNRVLEAQDTNRPAPRGSVLCATWQQTRASAKKRGVPRPVGPPRRHRGEGGVTQQTKEGEAERGKEPNLQVAGHLSHGGHWRRCSRHSETKGSVSHAHVRCYGKPGLPQTLPFSTVNTSINVEHIKSRNAPSHSYLPPLF